MFSSIGQDLGNPEADILKRENRYALLLEIHEYIKNMIHSDANLRLVINKEGIETKNLKIARVERLVLPAQSSNIRINTDNPDQPLPIVQKTWNLFEFWSFSYTQHLSFIKLNSKIYSNSPT